MKRQLIIILTALISACGQSPEPTEKIESAEREIVQKSLETFSITETTAEEFELATSKFKDKTVYDSATFKKKDGEINLPVERKWKPFVTYRDTLLETDETEIREYKYIGQFEDIGYYIVGGSFWEHYECYLIDKRTGRQTTIWNTPTISPNDKFIANLSMAYGLEGVPNGIQVWSIDRNENNQVEPISINKYLELDQLIWVPEEFVWETDNSLILKVISVEKFMESSGQPKQSEYYFLKLKLK